MHEAGDQEKPQDLSLVVEMDNGVVFLVCDTRVSLFSPSLSKSGTLP